VTSFSPIVSRHLVSDFKRLSKKLSAAHGRSGSHAIRRNLENVILAGSHEFGRAQLAYDFQFISRLILIVARQPRLWDDGRRKFFYKYLLF